jgi:hypothetical protein
MSFSGNVQSIFNAALNGCLAGMVAGAQGQDSTATDYNQLGAVALAVATEVDSVVGADATLAGSGATVVPASAANQANALAKPALMFGICFGYFFQRPNWLGGSSSTTATTYATAAAAIKAIYTQAVTQYGNAPGGTSLS